MRTLQALPPEILLMITHSLQDSYSDFALDRSVYSLARTCKMFHAIVDPLLYSRYSDEKQSITRLGKFIRTLISRPDLVLSVKYLSITANQEKFRSWSCGTKYDDIFEDVDRLETMLDRDASKLEGLELERHIKVQNLAELVGDWKSYTQVVTDPGEVVRWSDCYCNHYEGLLATVLILLSPVVQKLQIKRDGRPRYGRRRIFPDVFTSRSPITPLKLLSLKEVHYITSPRLGQTDIISEAKINSHELKYFLRIPTMKSLKIEGFAFGSFPGNWVEESGLCAIQSLDLTHDFATEFREYRALFSIFQGLKNFSYDGKIKDVVPRTFFRDVMEGLLANQETLESLSLTSICRWKDDHSLLHVANGFTGFSQLKFLKIQLDLLIGVEDESSQLKLKDLLPNSLETLELWLQCKFESPNRERELLDLARAKKDFPSLKKVKLVYQRTIHGIAEQWMKGMSRFYAQHGIELVFVLMTGKVWRAQMPLEL
ncbi:hypothetical protein NHQ30_009585 [Ciborinia camelliae]|nr:hypothetical protein NHQ30_009585 [Ciborinia camelliae]